MASNHLDLPELVLCCAQGITFREDFVKNIPQTENALVLRTDFSDDGAWESICAAIREPWYLDVVWEVSEIRANVDFVSDPAYDGIDLQQVLSLIPEDWTHGFIFVVDQLALSHPDHPVLVIDLFSERGRTFRVVPSEMWAVENNLSLANMDFRDFADAVDPDGIFRGFPKG